MMYWFLLIAYVCVCVIVFAIGEVGVYRRGGDVYEWTKKIDKFVPKWWN